MSNMVILTGSLTAVAAPMPDPSRNRDQHVGASRKIPVLEARHVGEPAPKQASSPPVTALNLHSDDVSDGLPSLVVRHSGENRETQKMDETNWKHANPLVTS